MFNTTQELSSAITEVVKAYTSETQSAAFFVESLRQLKGLSDRLHSNYVRIALIGITSSGKSTLMNAILAAPLLPTRVAPSSSKQVICGYAKEQYALIKFMEESGKQDRLIKENIPQELSKYGDERYNLRNKEQVEELQVFSPGFNFRKELIFVDTPGLDAYGLTEHEEITLKLVLPSVDMVLFLTNVKCDSDKQNLDFIDRATSEDKPLVVVQNKIDSIEEKRSKHYGVEKTREQVKQEHYSRIRKLLDNAKNKSVRDAPIVQISAKCPKWEDSNLENLKEVLSSQVEQNLKRFRLGHIRQLQKQLQEDYATLSRLQKDHARQEQELSAKRQLLDSYHQNLEKAKQLQTEIDNNIRNKLDAISAQAKELIESLSGCSQQKTTTSSKSNFRSLWEGLFGNSKEHSASSEKHLDTLPAQIKQKFDSFKTNVREITPYFSRSITEMQEALQVCCNDMNLNYRQIVRITPVRAFQMESEDITETVQGKYHEAERVKVKQRGLCGGLKRGWGWLTNDDDCGYDWKTIREGYYEEKTVYSVKKMQAYILINCKNLSQFFEEKYPKFDSDTDYSIGKLQERYESLSAQLKVQSIGGLSKQLISGLEASINKWLLPDRELKQELPAVKIVEKKVQDKPNSPSKKPELLEENCHPWEAAFLSLAQSQCLEINRKYMSNRIKESNCSQACVCGWERNCIENFLSFFFTDHGNIQSIDFNSNPKLRASELSKKLVFLLVNAEQKGSAENKIYSPDIVEVLTNVARTGKIVWVMDTVNGLAHWQEPHLDTLEEAYFEMVMMAEQFMKKHNQKPYDFMACDSELYYSVLFHEMYFSHLNTESKRQNFIAEISDIFRLNIARKHITGQYLNDFNNHIRRSVNGN